MSKENGCAGTDFVDDTPNKELSGSCPGFEQLSQMGAVHLVRGFYMQNYMDYTDDACMCLFTKGQDARMETALTTFHLWIFYFKWRRASNVIWTRCLN